MAATINPLDKNFATSKYTLQAAAFDITNFRPAGAPANATLSADTPKGVLGGSIASFSDDWEVKNAINTDLSLAGLFNGQSEGNPFENSPGAASGVVPVFMGMGNFEVFVFETNSATAAYASILGSYTIGCKLYTSPFGLLTPETPSTMPTPATADVQVAFCTLVPTSSELKLGIKLLL